MACWKIKESTIPTSSTSNVSRLRCTRTRSMMTCMKIGAVRPSRFSKRESRHTFPIPFLYLCKISQNHEIPNFFGCSCIFARLARRIPSPDMISCTLDALTTSCCPSCCGSCTRTPLSKTASKAIYDPSNRRSNMGKVPLLTFAHVRPLTLRAFNPNSCAARRSNAVVKGASVTL